MRKTLLFLTVVLCFETSAFATWSVIAIDKSTRRVAMAAASCVNTTDDAMKTAIAVVVPGIGVAACQAGADGTHQNQMLVFQELQKGTDPKTIIEMLAADPGFQSRQFAILDMQGRSAGHSGLGNSFVAQYMYGQVPGTEIFYAVQGNTLRANDVVPKGVKAFIETKGALTDRVLAALEAGDAAGGDVRCACPPPPADGSKPPIPCDNKTSHVAYILMADPSDANGDSHHNGKYALSITVSQPTLAAGPDGQARDAGPGRTKVGESLNPVKTLRMRYDAWRKTQPANFK
jgi:hypothetical protein